MNKKYLSTRGGQHGINASEGIISGLAADGGLFVPNFLDDVHLDLDALAGADYATVAKAVFSEFLNDFSAEQIDACVAAAYQSGKFDGDCPVVLTKVGDRHFLELYHGPTCAFKDMALTILPHLMTTSLAIQGIDRRVLILTATSGDTGKAALSGFSGVNGIDIVVFYPKDGVSVVQEKQMLTQEGDNTRVIGVTGNFDDTQSGVKAIFSDDAFAARLEDMGVVLSSANSINIGRLLPQVVYYVFSYLKMVENGEITAGDPVNFVVPTGNFGNILAGYYASLIGVPVGKLICASNANHILTDFFETGKYDRNRDFYKTISPSMDILISSNLERLLFDLSGRDPETVSTLMNALNGNGVYAVPEAFKEKAAGRFRAGYADEAQTKAAIKAVFDQSGYLIDPHTAVASRVYDDYLRDTGDTTPTIVLSTASPYKFASSVYEAIFGALPDGTDPFAVLDMLSEKTNTDIPKPLSDLKDKPNRHDIVCGKASMIDQVAAFATERTTL
ncbi:MAG: threonine synthase [Eubacteriaceae bacterium]|nr:threonine synthase [Eubacteriaceae bacterium]